MYGILNHRKNNTSKGVKMFKLSNQENKDHAEYFKNSIRLGKSRVEKLLDEVESERHNIKFYQEELDKVNLILLEEQCRAEVLDESKLKGVT